MLTRFNKIAETLGKIILDYNRYILVFRVTSEFSTHGFMVSAHGSFIDAKRDEESYRKC